jgi:catechol 2,3-dioxygenase-like lactoylglutathione lyase family enzyme
MRVRPIHFVPDLAEALRFYQALGLEPEARSRPGHWIELTAAGGELDLHDARAGRAAPSGGRLPPEGTIVDEEWGRSLLVRAPDGSIVQVDEQDRELYT